MTKSNYIPPYDSSDIGTIIDELIENYIIDGDFNEDEYDELESIINETINHFNTEIMEDESIEDDEEMDHQDLRDDMYQAIENSVLEKYSKAIKD